MDSPHSTSHLTKYVLCGGYPTNAPDGGQSFVEAMTAGLDHPSILLCCFAKPKSEWETKRLENEVFFSRYADIATPLTLADYPTFIQEVERHEIIYLAGGNTPDLYNALSAYSTDILFWERLFLGKVVAGSSAGVSVLTKTSFNTDHQEFQAGLGIIDRASLVHYRSSTYNPDLDWNAIERKLRAKTSIPILFLKEGEFVEISQG